MDVMLTAALLKLGELLTTGGVGGCQGGSSPSMHQLTSRNNTNYRAFKVL